MSDQNQQIIFSIEIDIFEHQLQDKTLYGYKVHLHDSEITLTDEFLYGTQLEAIKKANSKLYGWIRNKEKVGHET